jgi:hypothetical protein
LDFEDLLELARDSYVDQFKNFVDQHIKKYIQGGPEVKLKLSEESSLYKSIYCADFITPDKGVQIIEMDPDRELSFDPLVVSLGEMEMTVEALNWDDIKLTHTGAPEILQGVDAWFQTWFDPEDENINLDTRFSGHIHSLLIENNSLSVDFGTAPVQAFIDLLLLLEMNGAKALKIF